MFNEVITKYNIKCVLISLTIFVTSLALLSNANAENESILQLSPQEHTWLEQHKTIRMGVDANYAPYSFVNNKGIYQGVAADFMQLIEKRLGVKLEIVPGLAWPEIVDGVKNGKLDIINVAVKTEEREKVMGFSQIYVPTPLTIMTRIDDTLIRGPKYLEGKKIALVEGYSSTQKIIREHPSIEQFIVDTPLTGLRAVSTGQVDAYIGALGVNVYQASKFGVHNIKVAGPYEMTLNGQRIAVRKDWPELVSILDMAIDSITEEERIRILNKWVPVGSMKKRPQQLALSAEEKAWLQEHKEIRLAVDPEFAPVEFVDERGKFSGIAADYIRLINNRLGISIRRVPDLTWSQSIEAAKNGQIDMFSAITPTVERESYLSFTQSYIKYRFVIFTRDDYPFISGLNNLSGKRVTVVKDYVTHELTENNYPDINLIFANTIYDGLYAVVTGSADAFIGDTATSTYVIRKNNLSNLKVAAPTEFQSEGHAFGVRKDWPELVGILNKALNSVSSEERLTINKKWVDIEIEEFPAYFIWIAIAAGGLMLVFVFTSTLLRIQVRRKTNELILKNEQLENEIVAREAMKNALSSSEKRLTHFFHATFEMVFFHDNGKVLDVNPAVLNITGYTPEDLIGNNLLSYVDKESKQKVTDYLGTRVENRLEVNIIKKDGDIIPVEIHARSIELEGRKVSVVSLRDISERKSNEIAMQKARQALQQAYDELEIKVKERTYELATANKQLLELDKLKSMFIASMSHELRTFLNSIIGFTGIILQGMSGEINDKQKDQLQRVYNSAKHLLSLITDVIDISKIEAGRVSVYPEGFQLLEVIDEAYSNVQNHINQKGLQIRFEVPNNITMYTDRKRLFQCVLNYLSNATKYTEKGDITVTAQLSNNQVNISVVDTGIGIADKDMPMLFEAFERFESQLKIKEGGTGLGLYLTKKITTELLKGEVKASSELGKGSTFQLLVPMRIDLVS